MPVNDDVDYKLIAEKTNGYSGADIKELYRKTGLFALKRIYKLRNENSDNNIVSIKEYNYY